ncbi:MAG: FHA domain-containing protein [Solirubrobacterales bacterium]|nr:FHA domain-containing protein [Solirubrobacterales bacterium]
MLELSSLALQIGFLTVLYVFLFWVATSALRDVAQAGRPAAAADPDATGLHAAVDSMAVASSGSDAQLVVVAAPGHETGWTYDIGPGATLGRGDVEIRLEDQFASSRHARIIRQGSTLVLEDLDSTNGTWLNDSQLGGPTPLHAGDRIRIGDSEFRFQP